MFDTSIHGPFDVTADDHDWASALLAEVAGDKPASDAGTTAAFSSIEQQAVRLGLLEGERPVARGAHSNAVGRAKDWLVWFVLGDRRGSSLANPRLEALRRFTAATRHRHGGVDRGELSRFLRAGFNLHHALEIAICAVATSIGRFDARALRGLRAGLDQRIEGRNAIPCGG